MGDRYSRRLVASISPLILTLALFSVTAGAYGIPEGVIVKVEKPARTAELAEAGMLFLADIGDAYIVQGTRIAAERVAGLKGRSTVIAATQPGRALYLVNPKTFAAELLYSGGLVKLREGMYLAQLDSEEAESMEPLPFSKVRLKPRAFPQRKEVGPALRSYAITPKPEIEHMVAQVSGDSVWKYISQLSGEEPVIINGLPDTLLTRYSFNWRIDHAADYLRERFEEYGVAVEFQEYVQGAYDFYDLDFVDDTYGWVVGYRRIFKTADGGLSWVRQKTGGFNQVYLDVCFLDSLEGWIAGSPGIVYHTTDGGASWTNQPTPGGFYWINDVFFIDSLDGWIAADDGAIAGTTDGGQTWTAQTTGTSENIYGLWFNSPTRGWACGAAGTILFWDGISWSPQTSGATDFLRDLCFIDDYTGWAAGADRTLLKTTDAGGTWTPMPVPASPNPYLMDVCFVDSLEGWVPEYDGTVLHTTDGGSTWEAQHAEGAPKLYGIDFVSASEGWVTGLSCAVQHTDDAGATWSSQTTNLPSGAWRILKNVVATKGGTLSSEEVIICGHYDCVSEISNTRAPGADDNASGVAAVLETARVLAPYSFERSIKFVCFAGEEQGLFGSSEYAGRAYSAGDDILGVVNLDMIGYVNVAPEDLDIVSDSASDWLADFALDCAVAYVPSLTTTKSINPDMVYSDHASFWRTGYHALHCAEDSPIHYPDYHSTGDTLGNLDQGFATDVVMTGLATIAELAVVDSAAAGAVTRETALVTRACPNPFGEATRIGFSLSSPGAVEIAIFNTEGKLVRALIETHLPPGPHETTWDGKDRHGSGVSPGVYFVRVRAGKAADRFKVVLLR